MAGDFTWIELLTGDIEGSKAFYGEVLGWSFEDSGQGKGYALLKVEGANIGGMMPWLAGELPGGRPFWRGYVAVDDVAAAACKLVGLGGKVHMPFTPIPGVGAFAVVADPQDAVFMLYNGPSGASAGMDETAATGYVGWRELYVNDLPAALDFYQALFGWKAGESFDMGEMGPYQIVDTANGQQAGVMKDPGFGFTLWLYYFTGGDIDAATGRVQRAGGQVMMGPQQVPGGAWIAQCTDPQGAMFALLGTRG